jgi:hypothetical protein
VHRLRQRTGGTADANGFLAFGNLDFVDAGFFQQFNQFLYFTNVHHITL